MGGKQSPDHTASAAFCHTGKTSGVGQQKQRRADKVKCFDKLIRYGGDLSEGDEAVDHGDGLPDGGDESYHSVGSGAYRSAEQTEGKVKKYYTRKQTQRVLDKLQPLGKTVYQNLVRGDGQRLGQTKRAYRGDSNSQKSHGYLDKAVPPKSSCHIAFFGPGEKGDGSHCGYHYNGEKIDKRSPSDVKSGLKVDKQDLEQRSEYGGGDGGSAEYLQTFSVQKLRFLSVKKRTHTGRAVRIDCNSNIVAYQNNKVNKCGKGTDMRQALLLVVLMAVMSVIIPMAAASAVKREQIIEPAQTIRTQPLAEKTADSMSDIPQQSESKQSEDRLKIYDHAEGRVLELSVDEYIRGAVASEMPASFHQQALNAQALAAHSWAVYSRQLQQLSPDPLLYGAAFSVDSERCEGYMTKDRFFERYGDNAAMLWSKICAAADYAANKIVTFEGETALTAYHSASAGNTEYSENVWERALPYLVSVESEGDELSPYYQITEKYDKKTMKLLLQQQFPEAQLSDDHPEGWIEILERSEPGYVIEAEVGGIKTHGQQVRTALSLKSGCFEVGYDSGTFSIATSGYGHGVGMSQYGAEHMAQQGSSAEEIISHYYPGTEISSVS